MTEAGRDHSIICPSCCGSGRTGAALVRTTIGCDVRESMRCWRCKGDGRVPARMEAWIATGKRLRQERLERNRSVREQARHLSRESGREISPADVSDAEHGRVDPDRFYPAYALDFNDRAGG